MLTATEKKRIFPTVIITKFLMLTIPKILQGGTVCTSQGVHRCISIVKPMGFYFTKTVKAYEEILQFAYAEILSLFVGTCIAYD